MATEQRTMAEDNARDMATLRKLRAALASLREVREEGRYDMSYIEATERWLEKRAEHIEAVWN